MTAPSDTRAGKRFRDLVNEAKARIHEISVEDLRGWLAEDRPVTILDVREADDSAQSKIPGAQPIPRGILELEIDELVPDQSQEIVLYCGGGSRSALAAATLQEMGYTNVHSLAGGYRAWQ